MESKKIILINGGNGKVLRGQVLPPASHQHVDLVCEGYSKSWMSRHKERVTASFDSVTGCYSFINCRFYNNGMCSNAEESKKGLNPCKFE